jgi:hypothetical protein
VVIKAKTPAILACKRGEAANASSADLRLGGLSLPALIRTVNMQTMNHQKLFVNWRNISISLIDLANRFYRIEVGFHRPRP